MTAFGHYITALTMGVVGSVIIIHPEYDSNWVLAFGDAVRWAADSTAHGILYAPVCVVALCFMFGCAMGAWAPDWTEFAFFYRGYRQSFIPHRTLTHTVTLWIFLSITACWFMISVDTPWHYLLSWLAFGFTLAGLLHVLIDMLSPTGVPILKPFGPRASFRVYCTGDFSELKVTVPFVLSGVGFITLLW